MLQVCCCVAGVLVSRKSRAKMRHKAEKRSRLDDSFIQQQQRATSLQTAGLESRRSDVSGHDDDDDDDDDDAATKPHSGDESVVTNLFDSLGSLQLFDPHTSHWLTGDVSGGVTSSGATHHAHKRAAAAMSQSVSESSESSPGSSSDDDSDDMTSARDDLGTQRVLRTRKTLQHVDAVDVSDIEGFDDSDADDVSDEALHDSDADPEFDPIKELHSNS